MNFNNPAENNPAARLGDRTPNTQLDIDILSTGLVDHVRLQPSRLSNSWSPILSATEDGEIVCTHFVHCIQNRSRQPESMRSTIREPKRKQAKVQALTRQCAKTRPGRLRVPKRRRIRTAPAWEAPAVRHGFDSRDANASLLEHEVLSCSTLY